MDATRFLLVSTIAETVEAFSAVPVQPRNSPFWRRVTQTQSGSAIAALCRYQQTNYKCLV